MTTAATLNVLITANASQLTQGLKQADSQVQSFGRKMQRTSATIRGVGTKFTLGVTTPLVAAAAAGVRLSSDLTESINKVNVVFGENAAEIRRWSETSAQSFGLTQQEALEATGTFGNLFTSMNINGDASQEMSQRLVELSADLASFNNIDPTVALEKLRAGLVGEVEPLRTLGINLSAAAAETKALELGLAATKDELTPAMLAQARYALILEQSTNAQGDFARTSDDLANKTRIVRAQIGDLVAQLATQLLPYALQITTAISRMIEVFTALPNSVKTSILVIAALAAAVGPALIAIGALSSGIAALIPVVGALISPLGLLAAAVTAAFVFDVGGIRTLTTEIANLVAAFAGSEEIAAAVGKIKDAVAGIGSSVSDLLTGEISFAEFGETLKTEIGTIGTAIKDAFSGEAFADLTAGLSEALGFDSVLENINTFVGNAKTALASIGITVGGEGGGVSIDFGTMFDGLVTAVQTAASSVDWSGIVAPIQQRINDTLFGRTEDDGATQTAGLISSANNTRDQIIKGLADSIAGADFSGAFIGIVDSLTTAIEGLDFTSLGSSIADKIQESFAGDGEGGFASKLKTSVAALPLAVSGAIASTAWVLSSDEFSGLKDAVINAVTGLDWSGIDTAIAGLRDAVLSAISSFVGGLTGIGGGDGDGSGIDWSSALSSLDWGDYIPALRWREWIDKVYWFQYIKNLFWFSFIDNLTWDDFLDLLSWSDFIENLTWPSEIFDFSWSSWISGRIDFNAIGNAIKNRIPSFGFGGGGGDAGTSNVGGNESTPRRLPRPILPSNPFVPSPIGLQAQAAGGVVVNFGDVTINDGTDVDKLAYVVAEEINRRSRA